MPESIYSSIENLEDSQEEASELNRTFNACDRLRKIIEKEWRSLMQAGLEKAKELGCTGICVPENPNPDFDKPILELASKRVLTLYQSYQENLGRYEELKKKLEEAGISSSAGC